LEPEPAKYGWTTWVAPVLKLGWTRVPIIVGHTIVTMKKMWVSSARPRHGKYRIGHVHVQQFCDGGKRDYGAASCGIILKAWRKGERWPRVALVWGVSLGWNRLTGATKVLKTAASLGKLSPDESQFVFAH
jgi:hypothetical protein